MHALHKPSKIFPRFTVAPNSKYFAPSAFHAPKRRKLSSTHAVQTDQMKPANIKKEPDEQDGIYGTGDNTSHNSMAPAQPPLPGLRPPMPADRDMVTANYHDAAPRDTPPYIQKRYKARLSRIRQDPETSEYRSCSGGPLPFRRPPPSFPTPNLQNGPNLTWNQQNDISENNSPDPSFAQLPLSMPNLYGDDYLQPPYMQFGSGQTPFNPPALPMLNNLNMYPAANTLPFPPHFPALPLPIPMLNFFPSMPLTGSMENPLGMVGQVPDRMHPPHQGRSQRRSRSHSSEAQPPRPTEAYLNQASAAPIKLQTPQPLLVILDLNGTLLYRASRKSPPKFTKRPGVDEFLDELLKKYTVMIWSSAMLRTVDGICGKLFSPQMREKLVAEWGREMLGLSKSEYSSNPQVYKKLENVWGSKFIQRSYPSTFAGSERCNHEPLWSQSNTVLIDDSNLKGLTEPWNIIEIPEFTKECPDDNPDVFPTVLKRLETLSNYDDVSKVLKHDAESDNPIGILNPIIPPPSPPQPQEILEDQNQDQQQQQPKAGRKKKPKKQKLKKPAPQPQPNPSSEQTEEDQAQNPQQRARNKEKKKPRRSKMNKKMRAKAEKERQKAGLSEEIQQKIIIAAAEKRVEPELGHLQGQQKTKMMMNRSPSLEEGASSDSGNFLLDRLEASLDDRRD